MTFHRAWHQLEVEEMDNFTFRVASEEGHGTYFVDALAKNGKGQCDCQDFQCRIAPIYHGKKQPPHNATNFIAACKHQLRVKLYIADKLIQEMVKQKGLKHKESP